MNEFLILDSPELYLATKKLKENEVIKLDIELEKLDFKFEKLILSLKIFEKHKKLRLVQEMSIY